MEDYQYLFVAPDLDSSSSAVYDVNEFSLKNQPVARVSIRWGGLDYEARNYRCYYFDLPHAEDIFDIGDWLRREAEALVGEDWFDASLQSLFLYLNNEVKITEANYMDQNRPNHKWDDFGDGAKLALLVACRRRSKFEPPCRPNFEPGVEADFEEFGCG